MTAETEKIGELANHVPMLKGLESRKIRKDSRYVDRQPLPSNR